ncbi:MAG: hypothetical protein ACK5L3_15560 [Oscillospiraceae bacterium]
MAANLKTLFQLLKAYGKMDLLWFLRDTGFCLLEIATTSLVALANVAGMRLLAALAVLPKVKFCLWRAMPCW